MKSAERSESARPVSVVMGAYNAGAWIAEALDSVLAQTYAVHEVLVVDDGSTDGTKDIVSSYGPVVRFLPEEHRGRPHRNRGILEAEGQYIAFLDADDFWHPLKIERQMAVLLATGWSWSICGARWLDSETQQYVDAIRTRLHDGDILEALFLNNFIVASSPVVARRVFDEVGFFDETAAVSAVEDWDLWLRIAARFPAACVPEPLATVRLHAGSFLAGTPAAQRVRSLEGIIGRATAREPGRLKPLKSRALAKIYYAAGVSLFRQDRFTEARSYFAQAARHRPADVSSIGYMLLMLLGPIGAGRIVQLKRRLLRKPN